jgi:hypothetical protein
MICSSLYLVRFIVRPFVGSDSNSKWRKNPVAGQQRNSEHPYTEGMYQKQKRGTASISVDAVHRIGLRLDSNLPRKRIVTAFRALPPA